MPQNTLVFCITLYYLYGMEKKRFTFWLPKDLRDRISEVAKKEDRAIGWVVVDAIKKYITEKAGAEK